MYKQAILLRKDLKLSLGKAVAQACHASLQAYKNATIEQQGLWSDEGTKKVVLYVKDESELIEYFQTAKDSGLPATLIRDAGLTEIAPGTKTAVGIGPAEEKAVDKLCGELPLV